MRLNKKSYLFVTTWKKSCFEIYLILLVFLEINAENVFFLKIYMDDS